MIDKNQARYFENKKNRYKENLLLHPPQYTQEEMQEIIEILKRRNIKKVIDLGSGNGRLSIPLLQNTIQVTAVDISKKSLDSLQTFVNKIGISKNMLKTAQEMPKNQTAAVVGCDILHHIDLDEYLPKMMHVLKPKGVIIFSEPNILNGAWSILITFTIDWKIEWRIIYCNYFSLYKKLQANNFTKISIKGLGLVPPPLLNSFSFFQKINYFLGNLFFLKLFAYRYIIVAEKR